MRRVLLALTLLPLLPSCAVLVGAAIGAGALHATSEDTVELLYRAPFGEVFDVCEAQLERAGEVTASDDLRGVLEGTADEAEVTITVDTTEQGYQRVRVKARRLSGLSPDLDTATWLGTVISRRLEEG
jgi:hypothetical protein